jgi:erythronate-4-phosphate dehydrogenase
MNILADSNIPFVEEAFGQFGIVTLASGRTITTSMLAQTDILLVRSVTNVNEKLLAGTPVRFVGTATIGTDHIDREYLNRNNIGFASAPGSNARSVAQYIAAALLQCSCDGSISLAGKTLGIIGAGHVGKLVRTAAHALGMHCLLNDPPLEKFSDDTLYVPLERLLCESDAVTMHVPLTRTGPYATYAMADAAFFLHMKQGAFFINTSRGSVVNETALQNSRKRLGKIVLDVWNNEPDIASATLSCADIATPHIAGYSYDGKVSGTRMIYNAACAFFNTAPAWNADRHYSDIDIRHIDVRNAADPVMQAVTSAYSINNDDAQLRHITTQTNRGAYFEHLRASYPQRLEFSHFSLQCLPKQNNAAQILRRLGFAVDIGE